MKKITLLLAVMLLIKFNTIAQMVLVFDTNFSDGTTVNLILSSTVNVNVDWGDGNTDTYTSPGNKTHTYISEGEYTVSISGTLGRYGYQFSQNSDKLIKVTSFGDIGLTSLSFAFYDAENLIEVPSTLPETVTDMSFMFREATLFNFDIGSWNVSNVINMEGMFWVTSFNQDIGNWDVSNVTNMGNLFYFDTNFNQDISNWDVGNVTNMSKMFCFASIFNQNLSSWDVSNVTDMQSMFYSTHFNQDIGQWNVSKVTNMKNMFGHVNDFNQDISSWDVSSVTNMESLFYNTYFNQDIGAWDVSKVTNMKYMFSSAYYFNQNLSSWDVSSVTDMSMMFYYTSFNGNIGTWDVSNVTNMKNMFSDAFNFNQNISNWDVSNVTDMSNMFYGASEFNQDINTWNISSVTDISSMFYSASNFNQNIGNWDLSMVTNMSKMFYDASAFNQDISTWNVSNVTYMSQMFYSASEFNQDIGSWNVSNVTNMSNMFLNTSLSVNNYDSLLIGWSSQILQPDVSFHAGDSKYSCVEGLAARNTLTSSPNNWSIADGGISNLPVIHTVPIVLDCSTGISGGNISNNCGSSVTQRGIVWDTAPYPTISDNLGLTDDGNGEGIFTSNIVGLLENTIYYLRAYAINSNGTKYGQQESFTTIEDDINPEAVVLPELIDECSVSPAIPTTNDACVGIISGTTTTEFPITSYGTTIVIWNFDDGNGNSIDVEQNVIVDDITDPTITCIDNKTIYLTEGETTYTVSGVGFDPVSTDDNCNVASILNDFNAGSTLDGAEFSVGTTTILWTAEDDAGNTNTCSFDFEVNAFNNVTDFAEIVIGVYPNPTNGLLTINFSKVSNFDKVGITISDITGKVKIQLNPSDRSKQSDGYYTIDLSGFANGIYIIRIQTDDEVYTSKIVKE